MPRPAVSVLLPVYNGERFIAEAIASVLNQTHHDFELIVVDDGSTDGTRLVLERLAARDGRIILHRIGHGGISSALNAGLALAKAPYVARMDADDVCRDVRLERQLTYMENHPECVAVGSFVRQMDEQGWSIAVLKRPRGHDEIDRLHLDGRFGAIIHSTSMLRADALRAIGGYRPKYDLAEDLDLFLRLAEVGRLANLQEILLDYRTHIGSSTFTHVDLMNERARAIWDEARRRRGLAPLRNLGKGRPISRCQQEAGIIYRSLKAGHVCTSVKHILPFIKLLFSKSS